MAKIPVSLAKLSAMHQLRHEAELVIQRKDAEIHTVRASPRLRKEGVTDRKWLYGICMPASECVIIGLL